jgi:RNA polymerase sigma-70 factor (ECF subfamily)
MDRQCELALVERLREGDPAAFDPVYEEFHARLFNFLARLCRQRDVAEDLLEETWLRFVVNVRRLRPDTRLAPWLFTVARNLYFSYCRSRVLEESHLTDLIGLWPVTATHRPSPFEEAAANDLERRVEHALARLPARCREVVLLVAVEGFSPAEAAQVCGVSPEALRQRLSRARVMLAKELESTAGHRLPILSEVTT